MRLTLAIAVMLGAMHVSAQTRNYKVQVEKAPEKCNPAVTPIMWVNSDTFKCTEDGKWILDKEAMDRESERQINREKRRKELYFALRSRILSDEEMGEVAKWGIELVRAESWGFGGHRIYMASDETEKHKELNEALLQQFKLRQAEAKCK
jgi:hypothetical protein